jgi:hypothetical protein
MMIAKINNIWLKTSLTYFNHLINGNIVEKIIPLLYFDMTSKQA